MKPICLLLSLTLAQPAGAATTPSSDALIVHALKRLTWGPRPGDVERVRSLGLEVWLDLQLHPERIPDARLEARLGSLRTVGLSTAALRKGYEVPPDARRAFKAKQAALGDNPSEEQLRQAKRELVMELMPKLEGRPQLVIDELQEAKLLRAVYSERQLDDVLVDFWMNHFNVYAAKGPDRFLLGEYERETIRPRAWGKFEDLLRATAQSPAMLFYLDNWLSADPSASFGRRGLNENYAREIMELHSLGVDGGYTQKDVTEVARCFTGWTMQGMREQADVRFVFVPALHDRGDKVVLGQLIRGGGREEGETVIHLLASHPSTARFIALKLARRFVADEPPAALVERAAFAFTKTGGDIRAVLTTILASAEFLARETREAKLKTPLEFVVSAVRATGANVLDARELAKRVEAMGMPLYMQQPPTGYKDTAEAWVSTSGLLARLNFALDLVAGRVPGTFVDVRALRPDSLVPGGLTPSTRASIDTDGALETTRVAGLILGSPEFQRR